jgi:hypothetical protein
LDIFDAKQRDNGLIKYAMQANTGNKIRRFLRSGFGIELFVIGFLPWLVYTRAQPELGRIDALIAADLVGVAPIYDTLRERLLERVGK